MMLKQTKIVASISDLRCDVDFIRELFDAGMNVVFLPSLTLLQLPGPSCGFSAHQASEPICSSNTSGIQKLTH